MITTGSTIGTTTARVSVQRRNSVSGGHDRPPARSVEHSVDSVEAAATEPPDRPGTSPATDLTLLDDRPRLYLHLIAGTGSNHHQLRRRITTRLIR